MNIKKTSAVFIFLSLTALMAQETWPQFRGPNCSGHAATTAKPPVELNESTLLWKVPLPAGHSSPVVWGDNIFLSSGNKDEKKLGMYCMNTADGTIKWQHELLLFVRVEVQPHGLVDVRDGIGVGGGVPQCGVHPELLDFLAKELVATKYDLKQTYRSIVPYTIEEAYEVADAIEDSAATAGEEISDAMNEAQDAAEEIGDVLEEKKEELDEAIDEAEGKLKN